jgi:hypothetical protein
MGEAGMIIMKGDLDIVIEWRKNEWSAKAYGVTIGEWFIGLIVFKRKEITVSCDGGGQA